MRPKMQKTLACTNSIKSKIQTKFKIFEHLIVHLANQGKTAQRSMINAIESFVLKHERYTRQFPVVLMAIHKMDNGNDTNVLSNDVLIAWKKKS